MLTTVRPGASSALMNGVKRSKSPTGEEQSDSSVQWCHHDRVWNRSRLEQPSLSQMLNFTANLSWGGTQSELLISGFKHFYIELWLDTKTLIITGRRDVVTLKEVCIVHLVLSLEIMLISLCACQMCYMPFTYFRFCLFQVVCCVVWLNNLDKKWPSDTSSTSICGFMFWIMRNCRIK